MNPQRLIEIPCSNCEGTLGYMLQEDNCVISYNIKCRWCVEVEISVLHALNFPWANELWCQLRYSGNMRSLHPAKVFRNWFVQMIMEWKYGTE